MAWHRAISSAGTQNVGHETVSGNNSRTERAGKAILTAAPTDSFDHARLYDVALPTWSDSPVSETQNHFRFDGRHFELLMSGDVGHAGSALSEPGLHRKCGVAFGIVSL